MIQQAGSIRNSRPVVKEETRRLINLRSVPIYINMTVIESFAYINLLAVSHFLISLLSRDPVPLLGNRC